MNRFIGFLCLFLAGLFSLVSHAGTPGSCEAPSNVLQPIGVESTLREISAEVKQGELKDSDLAFDYFRSCRSPYEYGTFKRPGQDRMSSRFHELCEEYFFKDDPKQCDNGVGTSKIFAKGTYLDYLVYDRETTFPRDLKAFVEMEKQLQERGVGHCGLSDLELFSIHDYTGGGYHAVNPFLWADGAPLHGRQVCLDVLSGALAKLPDYQGFVERSLNFNASLSEESRREMLARYQVGSVHEFKGYSSTSLMTRNKVHAVPLSDDSELNIRFVIYSETGKPVSGFSSRPGENEVLFDRGLSFKILKRLNMSDPRTSFLS